MSRFRFLKWASCLNLFVLLLIASSLIDNKNLTWIAIFICIFYFIFCKDNKVMNDDSALVYIYIGISIYTKNITGNCACLYAWYLWR